MPRKINVIKDDDSGADSGAEHSDDYREEDVSDNEDKRRQRRRRVKNPHNKPKVSHKVFHIYSATFWEFALTHTLWFDEIFLMQ